MTNKVLQMSRIQVDLGEDRMMLKPDFALKIRDHMLKYDKVW